MMPGLLDELFIRISYRLDASGIDAAQRRLDGYRNQLDSIAARAGLMGTAITASLAGAAIPILGFERKLNTLASVRLDATKAELQSLEDQARALGEAEWNPKAAAEVVDAQIELARAGLNVNEILAATPAVLRAAIAGELEMADSASLVMGVIKAWGLEMTDAEQVVDDLVFTSNSANTTLDKMPMALRNVAAAASALNIPYQTILAMLGSLQDLQLVPGQAGTALRAIMARILAPVTREAQTIYDKLGLDPEELKKTLLSGDVIGVLREFERTGATPEDLVGVFGSELLSAAPGILSQLDRIEQKLGVDTVGMAERAADAIQYGLPGAFEVLKSVVQGFFLTIGDAGLTGWLETLAKEVTKLVQIFSGLPPWMQTAASASLMLGPALLGVAFAAKALSIMLGALSVIMSVVNGIAILTRATYAALTSGMLIFNFAVGLSNIIMRAHAIAMGVVRVAALALRAAMFLLRLSMLAVMAVSLIAALIGVAPVLLAIRAGALLARGGLLLLRAGALLAAGAMVIVRAITVALTLTFGIMRVATLAAGAAFGVLRAGALLAAGAMVIVRAITVALTLTFGIMRVATLAAGAAFGVLRAGALLSAGAMVIVRGAVVALRTAWALMNLVMLANPIVLILALLVAAGVAIYIFRDQIWDGIVGGFQAVKDWLLSNSLVGAIKRFLGLDSPSENPAVEVDTVLGETPDVEEMQARRIKRAVERPATDASDIGIGDVGGGKLGFISDAVKSIGSMFGFGGGEGEEPGAAQAARNIIGGVVDPPGGEIGAAQTAPPGSSTVTTSSNVENRMTVEEMVINTQATDAQGIAAEIAPALEAEWRNAAFSFDSEVRR